MSAHSDLHSADMLRVQGLDLKFQSVELKISSCKELTRRPAGSVFTESFHQMPFIT